MPISNTSLSWQTVIKPSTTTRVSTILLEDDPDLVVSLPASSNVRIRGTIIYDTSPTADFKCRFTLGLAQLYRMAFCTIAPNATAFSNIQVQSATPPATIVITSAGAQGGYINFEGNINVGSVDDILHFQWAQNTSQNANTQVFAGSYIDYFIV